MNDYERIESLYSEGRITREQADQLINALSAADEAEQELNEEVNEAEREIDEETDDIEVEVEDDNDRDVVDAVEEGAKDATAAITDKKLKKQSRTWWRNRLRRR